MPRRTALRELSLAGGLERAAEKSFQDNSTPLPPLFLVWYVLSHSYMGQLVEPSIVCFPRPCGIRKLESEHSED